jgi:hypothetical protein
VGAAAALAVWAAALGVYWTERFHLRHTKIYERAYAATASAAREHFAAGTLVVAGLHSGALVYYTDLPLLRWEFVRPEQFARFRARTASAGRPIGAILHQVEEADALQKNCPGPWTRLTTVGSFSLWRLEPAGGEASR